MGTPNYPKDMASEWTQLRRDVKNAFTSANLRTGMAKIGAKVIEITGELALNAGARFRAKFTNNNDALYVGPGSINGQPVQVVLINRPDGSRALEVFGGDTVSGYLAIWDRDGHIIFSEDSGAGQGIARPWIPYNFLRTSSLISPPLMTSSSFAAHVTISGVAQHPKIRVKMFVRCTGTDTAQVRLNDPSSGTVIAQSGTISGDALHAVTLEGDHPNFEFGDDFKYDIEIRRVSGTGSGVGVEVHQATGRQT